MKSRQFEILVYLLKHKKSTYGELASLFEVSKKTIERDIDRLSGMNVPIYCVQGVNGGVYLDKKYKFTSTFFSPNEIRHIILALSIADSITVAKQKDAVIKKLCMIDPSLTTLFEKDMKEYLSIDLMETPINTDTEIFKTINYCLEEEVLARINEKKLIACLGYVLKNDGLYLFAYADDYLVLKVQEIEKIEPTEIEFERNFMGYEEYIKNNR